MEQFEGATDATTVPTEEKKGGHPVLGTVAGVGAGAAAFQQVDNFVKNSMHDAVQAPDSLTKVQKFLGKLDPVKDANKINGRKSFVEGIMGTDKAKNALSELETNAAKSKDTIAEIAKGSKKFFRGETKFGASFAHASNYEKAALIAIPAAVALVAGKMISNIGKEREQQTSIGR